MNIYITKRNEDRLRSLSSKTMSGLINDLLNSYFGDRVDIPKKEEQPPVNQPAPVKAEDNDERDYLEEKLKSWKNDHPEATLRKTLTTVEIYDTLTNKWYDVDLVEDN